MRKQSIARRRLEVDFALILAVCGSEHARP
jgi:hypothetical protein